VYQFELFSAVTESVVLCAHLKPTPLKVDEPRSLAADATVLVGLVTKIVKLSQQRSIAKRQSIG
jgi:hypothetical protein